MSFFYGGWTYIKSVGNIPIGGPVFVSDINGSWEPVCSCGAVKACAPYPPTGHSDWCDINNPPPETEELPF